MILNLAANAEKFTPSGRVTVSLDCIGRNEAESLVRISVEDTGVGIPAEALPRLFQKFEQADRGTNRRFGGTGLGLAIVKAIADTMNGRVGVESEEGRGSRFWIELPLVPAESVPAETADPGIAPRPSLAGKVLVAEDNLISQKVVLAMLDRLGVEAALARDGDEAVRMAASGDFDAILMDCQMPVLDGFDATAAIRGSESGGQRLPIIALTANARASDVTRCLSSGMDDFLAKPVRIEALESKLRQWLAVAVK
jgi:hypothetical protein